MISIQSNASHDGDSSWGSKGPCPDICTCQMMDYPNYRSIFNKTVLCNGVQFIINIFPENILLDVEILDLIVIWLPLSNNWIGRLQANVFEMLSELFTMRLDGNRIPRIVSRSFKQMAALAYRERETERERERLYPTNLYLLSYN